MTAYIIAHLEKISIGKKYLQLITIQIQELYAKICKYVVMYFKI